MTEKRALRGKTFEIAKRTIVVETGISTEINYSWKLRVTIFFDNKLPVKK